MATEMPTNELTLNCATTALLVMDYQTTIVERFSGGAAGLTTRVASVVASARETAVRVIYIVVGFRPGYPEVSPRNLSFKTLRASNTFAASSAGTEIHGELTPREGEVVITKHRVSGFHGTDLDMILRANSIDTLVLMGIATSGVVLSTLRQAADADYSCIVVKDGCGDLDAEVHRVLTEKVFPRQAKVVTCEDVVAAMRRPSP